MLNRRFILCIGIISKTSYDGQVGEWGLVYIKNDLPIAIPCNIIVVYISYDFFLILLCWYSSRNILLLYPI
jgi:hypothetical protein